MRILLIAGLFTLVAGAALAQISPHPLPPPRPIPHPTPAHLCADLTISSYNVATSMPAGNPPLRADEVALAFEVRNVGTTSYTAPDENKQWITLEFPTSGGVISAVGANVLPPSGSGPVSLAPGAGWRGFLRARIPAVFHHPYPASRLAIKFAPAALPGWPGPAADCNHANDTRPVALH
jgi:hypothetical protein